MSFHRLIQEVQEKTGHRVNFEYSLYPPRPGSVEVGEFSLYTPDKKVSKTFTARELRAGVVGTMLEDAARELISD